MDAYLEEFTTPGGRDTLATHANGALIGLQFGDGTYPRSLAEELQRAGYTLHRAQGQTDQARREIEEYWRGERITFDVALAWRGTAWQIEVWQALICIPFGTHTTYGALALQLGRPQAARAVGRANATNQIPLVVPCHRLLGADRSLTGFAGGTHLKQRLLDHEAAVLARRGLGS